MTAVRISISSVLHWSLTPTPLSPYSSAYASLETTRLRSGHLLFLCTMYHLISMETCFALERPSGDLLTDCYGLQRGR